MRSQTITARRVRRTGIVLLAAQGAGVHEIARRREISRGQVIDWRDRLAKGGLATISANLPERIRKPGINTPEIVHVSTQTPPEDATHWRTRNLVAQLDISHTTRAQGGADNGLKLHRIET